MLESIVACYRERNTDKPAMPPDLSLHGEADDVPTVIEVVDHNPANRDKLEYYRMRMMILIVVRAMQNRSELWRDGIVHADVAKYRCLRVAA